MDPVSAGIGAGASLLSGVLGNIDWGGDRAAQRRMMESLIRRAGEIKLPELERLRAETLGPSAMEGVFADPALEAAQYETLADLGRISRDGGLTLEDRAVSEDANREAAQRAMAQRRSIQAMLARQGQGGATSGASVAMQLGAAREQADRAAQTGLHQAASAQRRAMEAMLKRGGMAGQVRSQQFAEGANRASAHDAIERDNAGARSGANAYNASIPQQQFQNQMSRLGMQAGPTQAAANFYGQSADRLQGQIANFGTGLGQAGAGIYEAFQQPKSDGFRTDTLDDKYLR